MRLMNKVALITGAAQGLGAAIARRFHEEGALVFIADINVEEGEKTAGELEGAMFLELDVTSEVSWKNALAALLAKSGRLDVLINNAGINIRRDIEAMPADGLDAMLAVNVKGPFLGIKHALPILRAGGGGSILNMSSICGLIGHKYTNEG
jgi:NAD(P)-dependent dehydrogenase (short-subunit alcohol dehydrogenase family)